MPLESHPLLILVMGVSGSGKSTVGQRLADEVDLPFLDADGLHSAANREKMSRGTPLTDDDRAPWLDAVAAKLAQAATTRGGLVLACSALRRPYRDRLRMAAPALRIIHLAGPPDVIRRRLEERSDHFMPATLLDNQLATLEPPLEDELPIVVDISKPVDAVVAEIAEALTRSP